MKLIHDQLTQLGVDNPTGPQEKDLCLLKRSPFAHIKLLSTFDNKKQYRIQREKCIIK